MDRRTKEGRERKRKRGKGRSGRGGEDLEFSLPFTMLLFSGFCPWGLPITEPPTPYLECWIIGLALWVVTKFVIKFSSLLALEEQWPHASVYLWVPRSIPPGEGGCLMDSAIMVLPLCLQILRRTGCHSGSAGPLWLSSSKMQVIVPNKRWFRFWVFSGEGDQ